MRIAVQTFITQVELDDDSESAHQRLNAAMEAHGFIRTITARNNLRYVLPRGHFCKDSESVDEVRSAARSAASAAAGWYSLFTAEVADREWMGVDFVSGLVMEREPAREQATIW